MDQQEKTDYQSLADIRLRKAQLQTSLERDGNRVRRLADGFLHPKKKQQKQKMTLSSVISASIGVVDGALFAWKVYRKFGGSGGKLFGRKKR